MFKKLIIFFIIIASIVVIADDYNLFSHEEEQAPVLHDSLTALNDQQPVQQQNSFTMNSEQYLRGIEDAKKDAQGSVLFCFSGSCLQLIGVILPYVINYDPPAEKLVGKSADYIMGYSKQYNSSMKNKNMINAIIGFVAYLGVYVLFIGVFLF